MISLSIAALILLGLTQFYLRANIHYFSMQKILNQQLDLQWIAALMSHSIRQAGFTPCVGIENLQVYGGPISALIIKTNPQPLLQINHMYEWFYDIKEIISPSQLVLNSTEKIKNTPTLLLADCVHAEFITIARQQIVSAGLLVQLANPLHFEYQQPIYLGEWLQEQWYVQNKKNAAGLYYRFLEAEELSPLIHSLQITKQRVNGSTWINLLMGLDNNFSYKISVAVRS